MAPFRPNPAFVPHEIDFATWVSLSIFWYIFCVLVLAFCVKLGYILFRHFTFGDVLIPSESSDSEPDNSVAYGTFQSQYQYASTERDNIQTSSSASGNDEENWERYGDQERELLLDMSREMGHETNHVRGVISERDSSDESDQRTIYTICGRLSDGDLAITEEDQGRERQENLKKNKKRVRFAGMPVNDYRVGSLDNRMEDSEALPPYAPLVCLKCGMVCENCEIETGAEGKGKRTTIKRKEFAKGKMKSKSSRRSMGRAGTRS